MTDNASSTFAIRLRDETSGPAKTAASALEDLKAKIEGDRRELSAMGRSMRELKGGTGASVAALREMRDRMQALKGRIRDSNAEYVKLGGSFRVTKKATEEGTGGLEEMVSSLRGLRGTLAGGAILGGLLALASGVASVTRSVIEGTAALLRYGLAQADAARSERLHLEGLQTLPRFFGQAAGGATEMQGTLDRLSTSTTLGRDRLRGYSEQLYRMGLRGSALEETLEGVAITDAVQGEAYARRFAGMAAGAARLGRSVHELAEGVRRRLGGIAAQQLIGLDAQAMRLRESFTQLFGGLRIERFLRALDSVTRMFSQQRAEGRALRTIVNAIFQPMLDGATDLIPTVRRLFQGALLGGLRFLASVLRLRNVLRDTFGGTEILKSMGVQRGAFELMAGAVDHLGRSLTSTLAMYTGFALVLRSLGVFDRLNQELQRGIFFWRVLFESDWTVIGRSITDGIIAGIESGRDRVGAEIERLADGATTALRRALGIASPSRVFASLGLEIPRGLAAGVDRGAPAADRAVAEVVAVPTPQGRAAAAGAAGAGPSVTIGEITVMVKGGGDDVVEAIRERLAAALEGMLVEVGGTA